MADTQRNNLTGKTALVTGAAKRLGREIALALAQEGVNIAVHYRESAAAAESLRCELLAQGVKARLFRADFENEAEPARLFQTVMDSAGPVDILVNNASFFAPGTIHDMSFPELVRNLQVNAWAPFVLGREMARHARRGKIINLLDSRVTGFDLSHVSYAISKNVFALLTEMMAVEFAPGITVNSVAPGLILAPAGKDEAYLNDLSRAVPLRRHGAPGDITGAVLYLLKAEYVTGQVVFADGVRHLLERNNGPDHHQ